VARVAVKLLRGEKSAVAQDLLEASKLAALHQKVMGERVAEIQIDPR